MDGWIVGLLESWPTAIERSSTRRIQIHIVFLRGRLMPASFTSTGTLETDQLVRLDKPVSLRECRVRVTLEPLLPEERTGETLIAWIEKARADLADKGYRFSLRKCQDPLFVNIQREGVVVHG
jgi:hypothetical protein